ncbi:MAG: Lrp/AsnC family transcriptional regulator [Sulfuricellaceae bacterium]|jgi:DNA-binding Lrp family transcriptional regulator
MDDTDRAIINALQGGFPICERPYAEAASRLGIAEEELIARLEKMLADKVLTRFGPLYNADRMGGAFTLAAMSVPEEDFERVAEVVNALPQVAHNYRREHALNMWFVVATDGREGIDAVLREIAERTCLDVFNFPKEEEFFLELKFVA